jgi:hypothetical protein
VGDHFLIFGRNVAFFIFKCPEIQEEFLTPLDLEDDAMVFLPNIRN